MRTKFLLLYAISFLIVFSSHSQINKGRHLLGGSFAIFNAKNPQPYNDDIKNEAINANIQFGKVVQNNTVIGVNLSYGYSRDIYTANNASNDKSNQYSAGLFYRKYKRLVKDFNFFGEADATYFFGKGMQESSNTGSPSKTIDNGGSIAFIPGLSYSLCKRLQMEVSMPYILSIEYLNRHTTYQSSATQPQPDKEGSIFSFGANLNSNAIYAFAVGFKFLLGK